MASHWTPEKDAELTRLWQAGHSLVTIMEAMNSTRGAIAGRARRLGLANRRDRVPRQPQPVPPPKAKARAEVFSKPEGKRLVLWELRPRQCKWPVGGEPERFCGEPMRNGHAAYCGFHAELSVSRKTKEAAE